MFSLHRLFDAYQSPRFHRVLRKLGREASAVLDAVTRPGQFVAEVEKLRVKPARTQQA